MRIFSAFLVGISLVIFAGCSSKGKGFNRGALKQQLGVQSPVVNDAEIEKTMNLKPNLPKPFKLGVYFKPPKESYYYRDWRWEDNDKAAFLTLSDELKKSNAISEVIHVSDSTVTGDDIKSIRLAAARHNADAVLVISGGGEVDRYFNNMGWSYFLIVTGLFVPGSEVDSLFMANATLWDVRNEYLYLTAESEALVNNSYIPAFDKENKVYLGQAKSEALTKLTAEIKSMVQGNKSL